MKVSFQNNLDQTADPAELRASPIRQRDLSQFWRLGTVSRAATLAFARILAFAAVIAGFAAALSLAIVLALTGVLVLVIKGHLCERCLSCLCFSGGHRDLALRRVVV
jgi:hypothetical protein